MRTQQAEQPEPQVLFGLPPIDSSRRFFEDPLDEIIGTICIHRKHASVPTKMGNGGLYITQRSRSSGLLAQAPVVEARRPERSFDMAASA
jgi:hypothetical protein